MRKTLFTLPLVLVAGVETIYAWDFQYVQIGNLFYNLDATSKIAEVIYQEQWSSSNYADLTTVTIPSTVEYNSLTYSVTSIGGGAFNNCSGLTSVTIPNSITNIGAYAFEGCSALTSIEIPNSVTSIGEYAFNECSGLAEPVYNEHVFACLPTAYSGVYTIPDGIEQIAGGAFLGRSEMTSIIIPNSVICIGEFAFYLCSGLTNVTIPNSVTYLGNHAFESCSGLTSVTLPDNVTSLGESVFAGCSSLASLTIPGSVTDLGIYAFSACSTLSSITSKATLPPACSGSSFTAVDKSVAVYVPAKSVTAYQAADVWKNFTNIQAIEEEMQPCLLASGSCGENLTWELNCDSVLTIRGNGKMTDYNYSNHVPWESSIKFITKIVIDNGVASIGEDAFNGAFNLTSVEIPNSVTCFGNWAFAHCSGLTSVSIPNNVTSIGEYAFFNCSGLTSVTIPNSVTSIGELAFNSCSGLTSIIIPNSVTSINGNPFERCSGLTSIMVEDGNAVYDSRENCNGIIETASNTLIVGCKNTLIPNSVTSLGWSVFVGCSGLTGVTIPSSVTRIGKYAFSECSGLTSITIPHSVTSIEESVFRDCTALTSVTIPNSVTKIDDNTFRGCAGLKSITIPNSVTSIGKFAFEDCSGLTSITCEAVTPPACGRDVFKNVDLSIPLYVPEASIDAYKATDGWKDYANILPMDALAL